MPKKLLKNTVYLLLRNNMENYDDNRVENFNSIYKKLIDLEGVILIDSTRLKNNLILL